MCLELGRSDIIGNPNCHTWIRILALIRRLSRSGYLAIDELITISHGHWRSEPSRVAQLANHTSLRLFFRRAVGEPLGHNKPNKPIMMIVRKLFF
jgi:hypothetical protein